LEDGALKRGLIEALEECQAAVLAEIVSTEELVEVVESMREYELVPESNTLEVALGAALDYHFDRAHEVAEDMDQDYEFNDQIESLSALAKATGRDASSAISIVEAMREKIVKDEEVEDAPEVAKRPERESEFTDEDLRSLFTNLVVMPEAEAEEQ